MSDFAAQFNAALKKAMSRSEAAAIAGRASAAARRAKAGGGSGQTTDIQAATDKAKRLIAANPGKYGPKGAKGKGKAKAGKAKDPKAEAAKAKEKADRAAEHAQRQKEHAEDRAQHQADREQRAKEHAQAQAEHAQSRAEHEQDRAARQQQQAARAKQQAAKAKSKGKHKAKAPAARTQKMAKAADLTPTWHGWAEITKVDEEQRIVYGVATCEAPDDQPGIYKGEQYQGDIVSSDAMRDATPDYMQFANIREMHQPIAAGTCVHLDTKGGRTDIAAHVVDDGSWKKVKAGVLKGFSIGGKMEDAEIVKIDGAPYRRITKLKLTEISLVDRPANSAARITLFKGADMSDELATTDDSADLAKAADPTKAIALLQQLRNDAETGGDMDAADEYTAAIRSVAQAAGIATTAADDEDADLSDDESALAMDDGGDDTGDVAMAASVGDLRKAHPELSDEGLIALLLKGTTQSAAAITKRGMVLSSANLSHAKTAHDALQKMTGGAVCAPNNGQPNGIAMAATLAPDDLAKAFTPVFDGIAKGLEKIGVDVSGLAKRLEHIEAQPAPGGPAARVVPIEKVLPGGDPPAAPSTEVVELNALRKLRDNATDDITRKALADEITKREIRNVYRPIE
jgi:hypothetical protein